MPLIATQVPADQTPQIRLSEGTITAIGLVTLPVIGAILRSGAGISGTATAAGIRMTGAAGYSPSVRRTLEAVIEGLAEAERERGPSATSE